MASSQASLRNEFFIRHPEFEKLDDDLIELFLSDAALEISSARWGKLYARGVIALAAHLLKSHSDAKESGGNANRPIASESAGELSVSFQPSVSNGSDEFYQLTAYGQEYLRLRKLVGVGIMVA